MSLDTAAPSLTLKRRLKAPPERITVPGQSRSR